MKNDKNISLLKLYNSTKGTIDELKKLLRNNLKTKWFLIVKITICKSNFSCSHLDKFGWIREDIKIQSMFLKLTNFQSSYPKEFI